MKEENKDYINQGLSPRIHDEIGYFKGYELFISTNPSEDQRIDYLTKMYDDFLTRNSLPNLSADELQLEIMDRFENKDDLYDLLGSERYEITEDEKNQLCGWLDTFIEKWDDSIQNEDPKNHNIHSQVYTYMGHGLATYREMMMLSEEQFSNWVSEVLKNEYEVSNDDAVQIIKNFIKFKNEVNSRL